MTTTISDPEATPATRAPQQQVDIADLVGATPELRALLTGYTNALDSVNNAPMVSWVKPGKPWLPHWLAFPALRYFAFALFVRYLYRCVDALKSGVMRRDVVSDNADEGNGDLKVLDHFEESLPREATTGIDLAGGINGRTVHRLSAGMVVSRRIPESARRSHGCRNQRESDRCDSCI